MTGRLGTRDPSTWRDGVCYCPPVCRVSSGRARTVDASSFTNGRHREGRNGQRQRRTATGAALLERLVYCSLPQEFRWIDATKRITTADYGMFDAHHR